MKLELDKTYVIYMPYTGKIILRTIYPFVDKYEVIHYVNYIETDGHTVNGIYRTNNLRLFKDEYCLGVL